MGKQRMVQTRKDRDVWEGFGISKEERDRAVQEDYVIDVNKRKKFNDAPKFTG